MSAQVVDEGDQRSITSAFARLWGWTQAYAAHPDPLAQVSNWVALTIGTHLPIWPLYIVFSAGAQAWPSALLTSALAPVFCVIPLLSRRHNLWARVATPLAGLANTVFTIWVLGINSGTEVFLVPCTVLAAQSFRWHERWLMLVLAGAPLVVWFWLQNHAPVPLHHYDPAAAHNLIELNVISIGILMALFGWFQIEVYRRMEAGRSETRSAAGG